jgi:hypothetical protein
VFRPEVIRKLFAILLLSFISSSTLLGAWAAISVEELVADSDLIVIGTLHSASEDSAGLGRGYILIEQIVSNGQLQVPNTTEGQTLRQGQNLKISWSDNWACAAGMHMNRVGHKGIWLLKVDDVGFVAANYPGRFRSLDDLTKIEDLWRNVKTTSVMLEISSSEQITDSIQSPASVSVDITPYREFYYLRASIVLFFSRILYWILYRSRFRFR